MSTKPTCAASLFLLGAALTMASCRPADAPSAAVSPSAAPPAKAAAAAATPVAPAAKTPAPPAAPPPAVAVRGIYVSGFVAGGTTHWKQLVDLVDKSELNALVIDVREDGLISYPVDIPLARQTGAVRKLIPDVSAKLAELKAKNIFPIARITCFRDRIVPKARPDLAIQRANGSPWRDGAGHTWLDPYNKTNWDYCVDLARDAARRGFREIQWDYVRFPSEGARSGRRHPAKAKDDQRSEARVIAQFLAYARQKLPRDVALSADVFGLTTSAAPDYDMGIGQKLTLMMPHLDVVCPMVYPSHYARGEYGIAHPNASPYRTVSRALKDGNVRVKGQQCRMRPWLQDFSLGGVRYGAKQVRAQIQAARDNKIDEYLLWNASNRYTSAALSPVKSAKPAKRAAPRG